jgi:hypothetical protein
VGMIVVAVEVGFLSPLGVCRGLSPLCQVSRRTSNRRWRMRLSVSWGLRLQASAPNAPMRWSCCSCGQRWVVNKCPSFCSWRYTCPVCECRGICIYATSRKEWLGREDG